MEAWSRRLMTHHAHPLLTPQCAARKIGRRKYRRTPLIAVAQPIVKRFARDEEPRGGERVRPHKFYSRSHTFLLFASPTEIEVRRRDIGERRVRAPSLGL